MIISISVNNIMVSGKKFSPLFDVFSFLLLVFIKVQYYVPLFTLKTNKSLSVINIEISVLNYSLAFSILHFFYCKKYSVISNWLSKNVICLPHRTQALTSLGTSLRQRMWTWSRFSVFVPQLNVSPLCLCFCQSFPSQQTSKFLWNVPLEFCLPRNKVNVRATTCFCASLSLSPPRSQSIGKKILETFSRLSWSKGLERGCWRNRRL